MNNLYHSPQLRTSYSQMLATSRALSKRKIKLVFISIVLSLIASSLLSVFANSPNELPQTPSIKVPGLATTASAKQSPDTPKPSSNANGTAVSSTNTDPDTAKTCTPGKSYAKPPTPVVNNWSNAVNLSQPIISSYKVYGNSANEISNQIYSCTPVISNGKKFAASTNYAINWSIRYTPISNSQTQCRVLSAGVGLSISKVFPAWEASANVSPNTKSTWNAFIANLNKHENEHQAIDQAYAEKLVIELKNLPVANCNTISELAKQKAKAVIASLDAANRQLDASTNHGATDGAKL